MVQVDWYIEGAEFSNCNCDYACPCQFESRRPTHGDCRGFAAVRVDRGHFGDVALDGLGAALLYAWPGPIYDPPLFEHIEIDANIERRKARIVIPDVLESTARPIRSPATGAEHRVRINLPNGIEFDLAEIGSGTTKTMASIALDLKDTYFHFTVLRQSGKGVVRSR